MAGALVRCSAYAVLTALTGCGARGDIGSSDLYETGGGGSSGSGGNNSGSGGNNSGSGGNNSGGGGSSSTGGSGGGGFGNSSPLGPCNPGFQPGTAPCAWLGSDGLCYPTREAACACLCPRDRDSVCRSGFPNGPDGRTPVNCS